MKLSHLLPKTTQRRPSPLPWARIVVTATLALALGITAARSQTYTVLHSFGGHTTFNGSTVPDGAGPTGHVVFDAAGNMYGTDNHNESGGGNIWEITRTGTYICLYNFQDGIISASGNFVGGGGPAGQNLVFDAGGNIYGISTEGGQNYNGYLFELTKSGSFLDLYDFGGPITYANGAAGTDSAPNSLYRDASGNFYGIIGFPNGPNGKGFIWKRTPTHQVKDLHDFGGTTTNADGTSGPDGADPSSTIAFDGSGNMYGSTVRGGPNDNGNPNYGLIGDGMIWKLDTGGNYTDLHDFGGLASSASGTRLDGKFGLGVTVDASGNLYGVTSGGGQNAYNDVYGLNDYYAGMVWEIPSGGSYEDLHDFAGTVTTSNGTSGQDGLFPNANVIVDSSGNIYGSTYYGGANLGGGEGSGMIFEISAGFYFDLHDFGGTVNYVNATTGNDGTNSGGQLSFDSAGNLYGVTTYGGVLGTAQYSGTVWSLAAQPTVTLTNPNGSVFGGETTTGTITLGAKAPLGGTVVTLQSNSLNCPVQSFVVPYHLTSINFNIPTTPVSTVTNATITATVGSVSQNMVLPIIGLQSLSLVPSSVAGDASSNGTITLTGPAPNHGVFVNLSSTTTGISFVPSVVFIANGTTSNPTVFKVNTQPVASDTLAPITGTVLAAGASITTNLPVTAATLNSVFLTNASGGIVNEGSSYNGTIDLTGFVATGSSVGVTLSSTVAGVITNQVVTVPAGSNSKTFSITINPGAPQGSCNIKATYNGVVKTFPIMVQGAP
jgi:hypothetical protein